MITKDTMMVIPVNDSKPQIISRKKSYCIILQIRKAIIY